MRQDRHIQQSQTQSRIQLTIKRKSAILVIRYCLSAVNESTLKICDRVIRKYTYSIDPSYPNIDVVIRLQLIYRWVGGTTGRASNQQSKGCWFEAY